MRINWSSFRVRLTVWNVLVLTLMLLAFSSVTVASNRARLASNIDRELRDRARRPPGPGRQPGGRQAGPDQQDPNGPPQDRPQDGPQGRPEDGALNDPGNGPQRRDENEDTDQQQFADEETARFVELRRPRFFPPSAKQPQPPVEPFDRTGLILARAGSESFSNLTYDGIPVRVFSRPVWNQQRKVMGIIQVARDIRDLDRMWQAQLSTLGIWLPVAILGVALSGFFLTGRAMKPIGRMKEAATQISEKDLSRRLEVEGGDEFAELGQTFNAMVSRLEAAFSDLNMAYQTLEESHEMQKRFTADASHELRTPLTRLRLATSAALASEADPEQMRKALGVADGAAKSMGRLVEEMLVLARADAGQLTMRKERLDLRVLVSDVLTGYDNPSIKPHYEDHAVTVEADSDHLQRLLSNLIDNALRYTPATGEVRVSVCASDGEAILRVADTGEGISPEHLPHLTERFYRADPSRSRVDGGCGLGLAICKTIAEAHGGTFAIESTLGKGTNVILRIPLVPNKSQIRDV